MLATIEQGKLVIYGRPTTSDIRDQGPVILTVSCRQSKENIEKVAELFRQHSSEEILYSSDLYHPAACGAHPRFDGCALCSKAFTKAFGK